MVVDIRYHLASLVAVFFALGLGILVGMSIASGAHGNELREQWILAVEKELEALRLERKESKERLEAALAERDLYREFGADLVAALIPGWLTGETIAVVSLGENPKSFERLTRVIEKAGAAIITRARMNAEGSGPGGSGKGEEPWFRELFARDVEQIVVVLSGAVADHRMRLEKLVREAERAGTRMVAVIDGQPAWREALESLDVPYLTHADSPAGELSLVLLLAAKDAGRYGSGGELPFWPKHLLETVVSGGNEP